MPSIDAGVLVGFAIGDEDEAIPTLPAKNATDITYTGNWTERTLKLTEDPMSLEMNDKEEVDLKAPEEKGRWERLIKGAGVRMVEITAYELGEKVLELCTNRTESPTGTFIEETTHATLKSVIFEFSKQGILYLPRVQIEADDPAAGLFEAALQIMRFHALLSTTLGYTSRYQHFQ